MSSLREEIEKYNIYKDELTEYTMELKKRAGDRKLKDFSEMRQIPLEEVIKSDIFYISDATEMLLPKYIDKVDKLGVISPTIRKPIFYDRYVIPIKDTDGKVLNLVGYSKEANERYVYGTSEYYRRRETMYGLENLGLAYELGYGILVEGITDAIRVRSLGYPVAFANCGTHNSDFIIKQLNRCRHGIIKIPDRDAPGLKASKGWNTLRSITLNTFVAYKDIDEMCRESEENRQIVKQYIDSAIEWIKSAEHRGYAGQNEIVTMYI